MKRNTKFDKFRIKALVPDLPRMADVAPLLDTLDKSRWYSNFGPLNERFEMMAREDVDWGDVTPLVVTASNATLALRLAFQAEGVRPGARVLVPAITFPATVLAVEEAGLVPVVADVDAASWELTPDIARAALEDGRVDAVMPVAVFGYPVDVAPWDAFVRETGVRVILDAAAAFGVQKVSAHVSAVFSLHATKPLGIGEGGLYVTTDRAAMDRFRHLSNFGFDLSKGLVDMPRGTNAKLPEMMAAVGICQMGRRGEIAARRASVMQAYRTWLAPLGNRLAFRADSDHLVPATLMMDAGPEKARFRAALEAAGIQSRDWYLPPLHRHPAFEALATTGALTTSEALADRLMGLPLHGFLEDEDVVEVAEVLLRA